MKARKIAAVLLAVASAALIVLSFFPSVFPGDARTARLLTETLPRLCVSALLLVLLWGREVFPPRGLFWRSLLWSLPCFLVAFANFPYSALISGSARIVRWELLPLFLLKCIAVALMEELCFRAALLPFLREKLRGKRGEFFLSVLLSAAVFGAVHLFNLLFGASLGATALQVGYTFLLGVMFGVMYCVTENVWLCVSVHTLFDIGGLIVTDLGNSGAFQDVVFWCLTAAAGVLCAVHIVLSACLYARRGGRFFFPFRTLRLSRR